MAYGWRSVFCTRVLYCIWTTCVIERHPQPIRIPSPSPIPRSLCIAPKNNTCNEIRTLNIDKVSIVSSTIDRVNQQTSQNTRLTLSIYLAPAQQLVQQSINRSFFQSPLPRLLGASPFALSSPDNGGNLDLPLNSGPALLNTHSFRWYLPHQTTRNNPSKANRPELTLPSP